ncbi:MAG: cysteine synthase A [Candidatus Gastranaerophilales bacterium]|nr:cysteine synthase A [Candidatus Gastranaerophilales bacterium]
MNNIARDLTELVGKTPMVRLNRLNVGEAEVFLKLEYFNPANSVKDRAALQMIIDAENDGRIGKNTIIIEPTSGNTGIGLAMVCAIRGYKIILTMPESMSLERRQLLQAYGAELVLTPAKDGMKGAVDKALELHKKNPDSFIPSQFDNPSNPKAHVLTTSEEIWADTEGKVDIFVAGVGTGGTVCGIAKSLKAKNPQIKIVAVEPYESQVLAGNGAGAHKIQGIGANFVPGNFDKNLIDEILPVASENAIEMTKLLPKNEGILSGISGGANVWAAVELSKRSENKGKNIVSVIPDCGDHYLSCGIFG